MWEPNDIYVKNRNLQRQGIGYQHVVMSQYNAIFKQNIIIKLMVNESFDTSGLNNINSPPVPPNI